MGAVARGVALDVLAETALTVVRLAWRDADNHGTVEGGWDQVVEHSTEAAALWLGRPTKLDPLLLIERSIIARLRAEGGLSVGLRTHVSACMLMATGLAVAASVSAFAPERVRPGDIVPLTASVCEHAAQAMRISAGVEIAPIRARSRWLHRRYDLGRRSGTIAADRYDRRVRDVVYDCLSR